MSNSQSSISSGEGSLPQTLSVFDAVSIIVGIVIGVSLFKVPGAIFQNVSTPLEGLLAWLLGAVVGLCGALTYAELATMTRRSGGEYIFLSRAWAPLVGFLFGWAQLTGVFSGSIGSMAFVFADYATTETVIEQSGMNMADGHRTAFFDESWNTVLAIGSVLALSLIHALGVRIGRPVQNLLTIAKLVGLGALLVLGLRVGSTETFTSTMPVEGPGFGLAMIFVLYAYGGWNDAAFVATEVKNPKRSVPLALVGGLLLVAIVYLLVNVAYLGVLGFGGLRASTTPAVDLVVAANALSGSGSTWVVSAMRLLVMVSALGAVHGLIFTGSRLYAALGADHVLFRRLSRWHPVSGAPLWALFAQAGMTVILMLSVGTESGRGVVDHVVGWFGFAGIPWADFGGGFDTLVAATAAVFWSFFLLSGMSVFILRWKEPAAERPFRVPLFPLPPIVFCLSCVYMLDSSIRYAGALSLVSLIPLAVGVPLYLLGRRSQNGAMGAIAPGD